MNFKNFTYFLLTLVIGFTVYSCANKAQGPTGGPKDVVPPKVLKSLPENGALNFNKKQVQIIFDENISVEKAAELVIVSPPQVKPPDVKAGGKLVSVLFNQDLADSTTYTISFGNSIVDLNEKNPLKDYNFAFSTGSIIDTLSISGTIIDAQNQNPLAGIVVGVYTQNDSNAFYKKPFLRIAKTNEKGRFTIGNLKAGTYKVYALDDTNRDYFFQSGEGLAFADSLVTPTALREQKQDTIWKDSTHIDTIRTVMATRFYPNNMVLRFFKENKKRQYFVKFERKQPQYFSLIFNTTLQQLPQIKPLNFEWEGKYMLQKNNTTDSLTYWITDSLLWNTDTLKMTVSYQKTDTLNNLVPTTDTLNVAMRKPQGRVKAKPTVRIPKVQPYNFSTNLSSTFDVYLPGQLRFEAPLAHVDVSKIKLSQKIDTVSKPLPLKWRQVDSTLMTFAIDYKWEPEASYVLQIDSAAFQSIYKNVSNAYNMAYKIRSLDEYSSMKITLANFDSLAVIQVLNAKDEVVATKPANPKGTLIEYLAPGDYYLRLFIDTNKNKVWDTGNLATFTQPEDVYYYPKKMTLMANWEFEETWDYKAIPLLKQKPMEIRKEDKK